MLRYIVYVTIALLAFMTGVGWVHIFDVLKLPNAPAERKTAMQPPTVAASPTPHPAPPDAPKPEQKVKFVCRRRLFSLALDRLRNEDPGFVDLHLESIGIENCTEVFRIKRFIDLNGDGRKEIVLTTQNSPKGIFYCGMNNCQTWVIEKIGKRFKILLDANSVQETELRTTNNLGYRDLATRLHGGATDHTVTLYKYGGNGYKISGCFDESIELSGKVDIEWRTLSKCGGR